MEQDTDFMPIITTLLKVLHLEPGQSTTDHGDATGLMNPVDVAANALHASYHRGFNEAKHRADLEMYAVHDTAYANGIAATVQEAEARYAAMRNLILNAGYQQGFNDGEQQTRSVMQMAFAQFIAQAEQAYQLGRLQWEAAAAAHVANANMQAQALVDGHAIAQRAVQQEAERLQHQAESALQQEIQQLNRTIAHLQEYCRQAALREEKWGEWWSATEVSLATQATSVSQRNQQQQQLKDSLAERDARLGWLEEFRLAALEELKSRQDSIKALEGRIAEMTTNARVSEGEIQQARADTRRLTDEMAGRETAYRQHNTAQDLANLEISGQLRYQENAFQSLASENLRLAGQVDASNRAMDNLNRQLNLHIDQELTIAGLQVTIENERRASALARTERDAANRRASEAEHRYRRLYDEWLAEHLNEDPYDEGDGDTNASYGPERPAAIVTDAPVPDAQMAVDDEDGDSLPDYEDSEDDEQPDIESNIPQQNTTDFSQEVMETNSDFQDANPSLRPTALDGQQLHSSSNGPSVTVQALVNGQFSIGTEDTTNQAQIETDNDVREDGRRQDVATIPQGLPWLPGLLATMTSPQITVHAPIRLPAQTPEAIEPMPAPGSPTGHVGGTDDIELANMLGDFSMSGHSVESLNGAMANTTLADDTAAVANGESSDSHLQPQQDLSPRGPEQPVRQPLQDVTNARDITIGSSSRQGVVSAFSRRGAKAPDSLGQSG